MTPDQLDQLTSRHLPDAFQERMLRATFMAHALSWQESISRHALTEAVNLQPFEKRAKLEAYLRDVADGFEDIRAPVVRVPETNWWFHTEIHAGPIVMTAKSVPVPCGLVDKSESRMADAQVNGQLSLLDEPEAQDAVSDAPVNVLLLHSPSRWDNDEDFKKYRHLPGSVYFAYPSADLSRYIHDVDLFAKFPEVVAAHEPQEWDTEMRIRYRDKARKVLAA